VKDDGDLLTAILIDGGKCNGLEALAVVMPVREAGGVYASREVT
jgi:hypothetical protein